MHIKYQRTSTDQQHGKRFSTNTAKYDKIFFDEGISGTKPFKKRTEAAKVVELVNTGKIEKLTVPELRDIGRNTVDSINTIAWLDEHDVNVELLSMGITSKVNGEPNQIWKLITSVFVCNI